MKSKQQSSLVKLISEFIKCCDNNLEITEKLRDISTLLMRSGSEVDVNETDANGDSSLWLLCNSFEKIIEHGSTQDLRKYAEVICKLAKKVENVDAHVERSLTPLLELAVCFHNNSKNIESESIKAFSKCMLALIAADADVNETDKKGNTALWLLCNCFRNLVDHVENRNSAEGLSEYAEVICKLAKKAKNIDAHVERRLTPLLELASICPSLSEYHVGQTRAFSDCMLALIDAGADVNETDKKGDTALSLLCCCASDIIIYLDDMTPNEVRWALCCYAEVILKLVKKAENVDAHEKRRLTPLAELASAMGFFGVHVCGKYGFDRAYSAYTECILALIDAGADVDVMNNGWEPEKTLLELLCECLINVKGNAEALSKYAEAICKVAKKVENVDAHGGEGGITPLLWLIVQFQSKNITSNEVQAYSECVLGLLNAGANVNKTDEKNNTALWLLCGCFENIIEHGNAQALRIYANIFCRVAKKAENVDALGPMNLMWISRNKFIHTPLVALAFEFHEHSQNITSDAIQAYSECVLALIDAGADVNKRALTFFNEAYEKASRQYWSNLINLSSEKKTAIDDLRLSDFIDFDYDIVNNTILMFLCDCFENVIKQGNSQALSLYSEAICAVAKETDDVDDHFSVFLEQSRHIDAEAIQYFARCVRAFLDAGAKVDSNIMTELKEILEYSEKKVQTERALLDNLKRAIERKKEEEKDDDIESEDEEYEEEEDADYDDDEEDDEEENYDEDDDDNIDSEEEEYEEEDEEEEEEEEDDDNGQTGGFSNKELREYQPTQKELNRCLGREAPTGISPELNTIINEALRKDEFHLLIRLKKIYGRNAQFRDGQQEAILAVLKGKRLLVIQKTGWGKSLVYFMAIKILREQGRGPAIIVSPLLSLMNNQIESAQKVGLNFVKIASDNKDQWREIDRQIRNNSVDAILVSPERLSKPSFREKISWNNISLLVIDEAHCISDWGHDFRPDFSRIIKIVKTIPKEIPVLATTATANDRVVRDIRKQLGYDMEVMRGPMQRDNLEISIVHTSNQINRIEELIKYVKSCLAEKKGPGVVYCLRRKDCAEIAQKIISGSNLNRNDVRAYHAGMRKEVRKQIEDDFYRGRIKVLCATVAFGMGIDKADIAFILHYQKPGNIIAYYQQIGRAGRWTEQNRNARAVMFVNEEIDDSINKYFICNAFPTEKQVYDAYDLIRNMSGRPSNEIQSKLVELIRNRGYAWTDDDAESLAKKILDYLDLEGVVRNYHVLNNDWKPDLIKAKIVSKFRWEEFRRFNKFVKSDKCYMQQICEELGDKTSHKPCGKCSVCRRRAGQR